MYKDNLVCVSRKRFPSLAKMNQNLLRRKYLPVPETTEIGMVPDKEEIPQ